MLWNERFAFGIEKIDQQHKHLYDLLDQINELNEDVKDGIDCYDEIEAVIQELKNYTIKHFKEEEVMMFKAGYEWLNEHALEHKQFIDKIQATISNDLDIHQEGVVSDLSIFLFDWVSSHILLTDVKYVGKMKESINKIS